MGIIELVKAMRGQPHRVLRPGSRGGKYWIDRRGQVRYGPRPKDWYGQTLEEPTIADVAREQMSLFGGTDSIATVTTAAKRRGKRGITGLETSTVTSGYPTKPYLKSREKLNMRLVEEGWIPAEKLHIEGPEDVAALMAEFRDSDREKILVLMEDEKRNIIGVHLAGIGTIDTALVSSREILKAALITDAARIWIAHNHPSGTSMPSPEDIEMTKNVAKTCSTLGQEFAGSLVIGGSHYTVIKGDGSVNPITSYKQAADKPAKVPMLGVRFTEQAMQQVVGGYAERINSSQEAADFARRQMRGDGPTVVCIGMTTQGGVTHVNALPFPMEDEFHAKYHYKGWKGVWQDWVPDILRYAYLSNTRSVIIAVSGLDQHQLTALTEPLRSGDLQKVMRRNYQLPVTDFIEVQPTDYMSFVEAGLIKALQENGHTVVVLLKAREGPGPHWVDDRGRVRRGRRPVAKDPGRMDTFQLVEPPVIEATKEPHESTVTQRKRPTREELDRMAVRYHVTDKAAKIRREGFEPRAGKGLGGSVGDDLVYVSRHKDYSNLLAGHLNAIQRIRGSDNPLAEALDYVGITYSDLSRGENRRWLDALPAFETQKGSLLTDADEAEIICSIFGPFPEVKPKFKNTEKWEVLRVRARNSQGGSERFGGETAHRPEDVFVDEKTTGK